MSHPYRTILESLECRRHQVVAVPNGIWCMRCNQTVSNDEMKLLAKRLRVRPDSISLAEYFRLQAVLEVQES